jgi:hypothetical protein
MICQLDYPHAAVWCQACWDSQQHGRMVNALEDQAREARRSNDLKEQELDDRPWPTPAYVPVSSPKPRITPPPTTWGSKGGVHIAR